MRRLANGSTLRRFAGSAGPIARSRFRGATPVLIAVTAFPGCAYMGESAIGRGRRDTEGEERMDARGGRRGLVLAMTAALLATAVSGALRTASGQTLTTGSISGRVESAAGEAIVRARVSAISRATGLERSVTTTRAGTFALPYLEPGEYAVFVEQVGYAPRRITGVPVQAGSQTGLSVRLRAVSGSVSAVDVESYGAGAPSGSPSGAGQWLPRSLISALPARERTLDHLLDQTTLGDADGGVEGLPVRLATIAMDGVPFERALHPDLPAEGLARTPFALLELGGAALDPNPIEVEAGQLSAAWLGLSALTGGNDFHLDGFGRLSPSALATASDFTPGDAGAGTSYAAGAVLSGAAVRDSVRLVAGFEARHVETPFLRQWANDATLPDIDLTPYRTPRALTEETAQGFVGMEWQLSSSTHASVRGSFSSFPQSDLRRTLEPTVELGANLNGTDASATAAFRTVFAGSWVNELRAGFGLSRREYDAGAASEPPLTRVVDSGLAFGADPRLSGDFREDRFDVSEAVTYAGSEHSVKVGLVASTASHEQTYAYAAGGEFRFGGAPELARREGAFFAAAGAAPTASFNVPMLGGFLQDRWSGVPGLEVVGGVRFDVEKVPQSDIVVDPRWAQLTGILNTNVPSSVKKPSARLGFRWDVEQRHEWVVSGGGGLYYDRIDPGVLAAVIRDHGTIDVRRGVGLLGTWPAQPDEIAAPVVGQSLSLMSADFEAPRTLRASFGIDRAVGASATLHVAASYRRTEHLPRLDDLNLLRTPSARDQFGRPIFGELVKQGGLLVARPGSSRRFDSYDVVSAYTSDGTSRNAAVSVGLDVRPSSLVRLYARYTYSHATDDWTAGGLGVVERAIDPLAESPDPLALTTPGLGAGGWSDGRSDFDVPSRLSLGGSVGGTTGGVTLRLAGLYTRRSGLPFTPGFRPGVDANADGSGLNDPAFVDGSIQGVDALLSRWDCLRTQLGRFAERNACRAPARASLDLRLSVGRASPGALDVHAFVDAIGLVHSGGDVLDTALYLVDPTLPLAPSGGVVNVPLQANPNFGQPLIRNLLPRVFRIGLQVSY